jgi:hypothetical protein
MRIARKLVLLCTMALAAMALAASSASAAEPIEVDNEGAGGANCNPCTVIAGGESHLNLFGIRVSTCADNFTAEIYHNGTGHIAYSNGAHDSGGTCTRIACNGVGEAAGESEFDILSSEETAANVGTMSVRFCLDTASNPNATGTHCTAPVNVNELATNHRYGFNLHATCAGGAVEVEGAYQTTGGNTIEIVHL